MPRIVHEDALQFSYSIAADEKPTTFGPVLKRLALLPSINTIQCIGLGYAFIKHQIIFELNLFVSVC